MPLDFATQPIWLNLLVFAVAAAVVWFAGSGLTVHADALAEGTGLGRVFAGTVLLAVATSLPEIATTVTASVGGNAVLAGNNLLGGISMQVAVLGVVDLVSFRRGALTFFMPRPVLLMQGVLLIGLLALTVAAITTGEVVVGWNVGIWSLVLAAAYGLMLFILRKYERRPGWVPVRDPSAEDADGADQPDSADAGAQPSIVRSSIFFALAALAVLIAGSLVARTGEAVAEQSGIGSSFIGATLVAISTSLPEVSTTFKAVRIGAYSMAVSNIMGTNAVSIALLLLADIAYRQGPLLDALDHSAVFLGALGILITAIYVWGMLERRDKTVLGMGYDSAAVLVCYLAGMVVLYFIT